MKLNPENLNINLRHLRALDAVAREGSFASAAKRLGIVPSALSELIRHLEETVGAALFDRNTRPPVMTPLALSFMAETAHLLADIDKAVTRLRQSAGLELGVLKIGASPSAISELVAPLLADFLAERPMVHCLVHDDVAETLAQMVIEGKLDIAVAGRALQSPDLAQHELMRDDFGLACRTDDMLARKRIKLDDLQDRVLIGLASQTGTQQLLEDSDLPRWLLNTRINAHSTIAQLCMVRAGVGLALLPQNAVNLFNDPKILFVPVSDLRLQRILFVLEPKKRGLSPLARAFVNKIKTFRVE
ncbi:LysR family transcriptional regulator [Aliirhizobium cellulosilyticum]|jgi:DNA-binding transcriptional LysR family regulator|nr:LysR family transcriptional regulator [Rhizobium cellulosilyticum]